MGDCRQRMERYLTGGGYSLVCIEERSHGFCWARIEHVAGTRINEHEVVWFELQDDDDRDYALKHFLTDPPTAGPPGGLPPESGPLH